VVNSLRPLFCIWDILRLLHSFMFQVTPLTSFLFLLSCVPPTAQTRAIRRFLACCITSVSEPNIRPCSSRPSSRVPKEQHFTRLWKFVLSRGWMRAFSGMILIRTTEVLGERSLLPPLHPSQNTRVFFRDQTRVAMISVPWSTGKQQLSSILPSGAPDMGKALLLLNLLRLRPIVLSRLILI